jgi:hypothetical protein
MQAGRILTNSKSLYAEEVGEAAAVQVDRAAGCDASRNTIAASVLLLTASFEKIRVI